MGLDFIRAEGTKFEQKRDDSISLETDVHELLSRGKPDEMVLVFQCQQTSFEVEVVAGLPLIARAYAEGNVGIIQSSKVIGYMIPGDAQTFIDLMQKNNHVAGLMGVIPTSEPAIDGVFLVKPKKPFKKQ